MVSILVGKVTVALRVAQETLVLPCALGGPSHPPPGKLSLFGVMATDARKQGHPLEPGLLPAVLSPERPQCGHLPLGPVSQPPLLCYQMAWGKKALLGDGGLDAMTLEHPGLPAGNTHCLLRGPQQTERSSQAGPVCV